MDNIVEISNLSFSWKKNIELLKIPEFSIRRGEKVFLKGPSGSGKSTLLGLLGGVYSAQSGSIKLLGENIEQLSSAQRDKFRADHVGFIFQMFNLLPYLSVVENVTMACHFSALRKTRLGDYSGSEKQKEKQAAIALLSRLGLREKKLLNRKVTELSVGQQQRVAVARALLGKPEIIIADEPTSALDADTRNEFLQLLMQESDYANSSLIFVSHDSYLQRAFDRSVSLLELNQVKQREPSYE